MHNLGNSIYRDDSIGIIKASGLEVLDLLNRLSTNDVVSLAPNEGKVTILTTDKGRIVDLITVLNQQDHTIIITSPGAQTNVLSWIEKYTFLEDAEFSDLTPTLTLFSIIGPDVQKCLKKLIPDVNEPIEQYRSIPFNINESSAFIYKDGHHGVPRYNIVGDKNLSETFILESMQPRPTLIDSNTFEALRINQGWPAYGHELTETYNPLEAGLWGAISFNKGCYIGQEVIARLDTYKKVQRHLVNLTIESNVEIIPGTKIALNGHACGTVTSICKKPVNNVTDALGYVRREMSVVGTKLNLVCDGSPDATVREIALPFGP